MGKVTGISWTDHTFNPWWGCTKVSPGCDHCYAETFDHRTQGGHLLNIGTPQEETQGIHWGKGAPRRVFGEKHWNEPLKWDREAREKFGRRARVFCASMADIMDDEAPEGLREKLWDLIDRTPNLNWQLLTKRPHRYERHLPKLFKHNNVWLGTTAENQEFYDVRWPILREVAASYPEGMPTWISYEPAIGPLTLGVPYEGAPDWIIFGGESGHGRRECNPAWAEMLLAECRKFGVQFFCKQMGGLTPEQGKLAIPKHLAIQEFPNLSFGVR
jgi:protein gp37